jgi:hypothetical protein
MDSVQARAERARFDLRHCCEDCGHFEPAAGGCRHFWPNGEHRRAYYQQLEQVSERELGEVVFCKEFELW